MRALSRLPDACGSSRVLSVSGRLITFARSHHACTHGLYECTMPALTRSTFADAGSTEPSGTLSTVSLSRSLRTPVSLSGLRALTYSIACCRAHPHPCTLTLCTSCHVRSCASSPLSGLASRLRVCGVGGSLASDPAPKVGCSCRAAHTHGHAAPALAPLWPLLGLGQHNARGAPADRFTSSPISP